ncbi:hypothetical protein Tco_0860038 [Tanacetum coccineum]|uniref:Uncharacterized protein n=1 Tax=Tanacetum coccineum TaxID=301880 RepID=A0ABQ5BDR6_9ASTR
MDSSASFSEVRGEGEGRLKGERAYLDGGMRDIEFAKGCAGVAVYGECVVVCGGMLWGVRVLRRCGGEYCVCHQGLWDDEMFPGAESLVVRWGEPWVSVVRFSAYRERDSKDPREDGECEMDERYVRGRGTRVVAMGGYYTSAVRESQTGGARGGYLVCMLLRVELIGALWRERGAGWKSGWGVSGYLLNLQEDQVRSGYIDGGGEYRSSFYIRFMRIFRSVLLRFRRAGRGVEEYGRGASRGRSSERREKRKWSIWSAGGIMSGLVATDVRRRWCIWMSGVDRARSLSGDDERACGGIVGGYRVENDGSLGERRGAGLVIPLRYVWLLGESSVGRDGYGRIVRSVVEDLRTGMIARICMCDSGMRFMSADVIGAIWGECRGECSSSGGVVLCVRECGGGRQSGEWEHGGGVGRNPIGMAYGGGRIAWSGGWTRLVMGWCGGSGVPCERRGYRAYAECEGRGTLDVVIRRQYGHGVRRGKEAAEGKGAAVVWVGARAVDCLCGWVGFGEEATGGCGGWVREGQLDLGDLCVSGDAVWAGLVEVVENESVDRVRRGTGSLDVVVARHVSLEYRAVGALILRRWNMTLTGRVSDTSLSSILSLWAVGRRIWAGSSVFRGNDTRIMGVSIEGMSGGCLGPDYSFRWGRGDEDVGGPLSIRGKRVVSKSGEEFWVRTCRGHCRASYSRSQKLVNRCLGVDVTGEDVGEVGDGIFDAYGRRGGGVRALVNSESGSRWKKVIDDMLEGQNGGLEKSIDQSDLKSCESSKYKVVDDYDSGEPIRRIESINTLYPVAQKLAEPNKVESEQLYSASANKIDEKKLFCLNT